MDAEVVSKYCNGCACKIVGHECQQNYHGSSRGMEVEGALKMFSRSEATRDELHENYLGAAGCKGFDQVVSSNPYGEDFKINKL